jgi:hypothetical protein
MKESTIGKQIQLAFSKLGCRLFRQQVGLFYTKQGFPIYIGVEGQGDFYGWRPVKITKEHVGKTIAQFIAIETKKPNHKTDKKRLEKQLNFITAVNRAGGVAFMCESVEEALVNLK